MNDLVSVIICNYNRDRLLFEAIDSVVAQTYRPIELVIIDDGSTKIDRSIYALLSSYEMDDLQITVEVLDHNQGIANARNIGIQKANGRYITFLDSDDLMCMDCISILVQTIHGQNAQIAIGNYYLDQIIGNGEISRCVKPGIVDWYPDILENAMYVPSLWARLYEKSVFFEPKRIEFHDSIYEDLATTYKILLNASDIAYVAQPMIIYRMNIGEHLSKTDDYRVAQLLKIAKDMVNYLQDYRNRLPRYDELLRDLFVWRLFYAMSCLITYDDFDIAKSYYQEMIAFLNESIFDWENDKYFNVKLSKIRVYRKLLKSDWFIFGLCRFKFIRRVLKRLRSVSE